MENNQLTEQVVPQERSAKYVMQVLLILFGVVAIPALIVVIGLLSNIHYLVLVAFFVLLFCIYGAWFFISSLKVDFEYAFLSSTMRIDKVIAKRRRKKMVKLDVKRIEDFFPFSDEEMSKHSFNKIYHAEQKKNSGDNYVICFTTEEKGKCAAIFSPNDKFLAAIKPYCSFEIRKKFKEYGL